jgi:hypothetical protein
MKVLFVLNTLLLLISPVAFAQWDEKLLEFYKEDVLFREEAQKLFIRISQSSLTKCGVTDVDRETLLNEIPSLKINFEAKLEDLPATEELTFLQATNPVNGKNFPGRARIDVEQPSLDSAPGKIRRLFVLHEVLGALKSKADGNWSASICLMSHLGDEFSWFSPAEQRWRIAEIMTIRALSIMYPDSVYFEAKGNDLILYKPQGLMALPFLSYVIDNGLIYRGKKFAQLNKIIGQAAYLSFEKDVAKCIEYRLKSYPTGDFFRTPGLVYGQVQIVSRIIENALKQGAKSRYCSPTPLWETILSFTPGLNVVPYILRGNEP